jgi:hypothetical protein
MIMGHKKLRKKGMTETPTEKTTTGEMDEGAKKGKMREETTIAEITEETA